MNVVGFISSKKMRSIALMSLVVSLMLPPASAGEITDKAEYINYLQEKMLKVYFPPPGSFNFAGSAIKIRVNASGKAVLDKIVQPPVVHGKRSSQADLCLKSAVQNVNPLEKPPAAVKLPAAFLVKFIPQAGGQTVFRCLVQPL